MRVYNLALLSTIALLAACNTQSAIHTKPTEVALDELPFTCARKFEITAELANPGTITGFECLSTDGSPAVVYRKSDDPAALNISRGKWISVPEAPFYIATATDSFLIVDEQNLNKIGNDTPEIKKLFVDMSEQQPVSETVTPSIECAEMAAGIITSYAVEGEEFLKAAGLHPDAQTALETAYSDLAMSDNYTEDNVYASSTQIALGNRAGKINQFCSDGGNLFGD